MCIRDRRKAVPAAGSTLQLMPTENSNSEVYEINYFCLTGEVDELSLIHISFTPTAEGGSPGTPISILINSTPDAVSAFEAMAFTSRMVALEKSTI